MRRTQVGEIHFGVLSKRERTILSLVLEGIGYKEIARRLGLTEQSLKSRAYGLCRDLRVPGRYGLLRWALSHRDALDLNSETPVDLAMHPTGCKCGLPDCTARREKVA